MRIITVTRDRSMTGCFKVVYEEKYGFKKYNYAYNCQSVEDAAARAMQLASQATDEYIIIAAKEVKELIPERFLNNFKR